jgi:hypothetical protein
MINVWIQSIGVAIANREPRGRPGKVPLAAKSRAKQIAYSVLCHWIQSFNVGTIASQLVLSSSRNAR